MKLNLIKFKSVKSTNDEAIKIIRSKKNYQGIILSNLQTVIENETNKII